MSDNFDDFLVSFWNNLQQRNLQQSCMYNHGRLLAHEERIKKGRVWSGHVFMKKFPLVNEKLL